MGSTGVRAGIIGEVGCSWPLTANERKVLRASGRAQALTGAPLLIHPGRDEGAPIEALEVLSEAGAEISQAIMAHVDRTIFDRSVLKQVAESGCYLEWDLFGREQSYYGPNPRVDMPTDARRLDDLAWISQQGYPDKVVLAHDICSKDRLAGYGGHGYFYLLAEVVPRMRTRGFTSATIEGFLVENPAAALTFGAPRRV